MHMRNIVLLSTLALLSGCSGGGSSESSPVFPLTEVLSVSTPDPDTPTFESDFYAGIFADSSTFQSACAVPRSGTDPFTGLAFSDYQGSIEQENYWLRSWSNELYLWYNEIVDQNPALFDNPLDYFDTQKSLATTSSGNPRDQFHFTYDSDEWFALSQSGVSLSYGASFAFIADIPPRKLIVSYTEPGSPAALAGLVRGTEITTVDGVDFINGDTLAIVDTINAALFPVNPGENHTFGVQLPGSSSSVSVNLVAGNIALSSVLKTEVLTSPSGNVGYILFNAHDATAEAQLVSAINTLKTANVADLVLDLRYNGGGLLAIASQMAYMVAGPTATANKTFELLAFNDKHPNINPVTGFPIEPDTFLNQTVGFSSPAGQFLPSLGLTRIFVLTGEGTCSASESIINGLRGINLEVIQIGSTTCGKPYGFYPQDNCGTTYFSIQFSGTNDVGFDAYSDGFSPQNSLGSPGVAVTGCSVADDFSAPLGDPLEARLAAAMQYRIDGTCPTPPAASLNKLNNRESYFSSQPAPLSIAPRSRQSILLQNKILGLPR